MLPQNRIALGLCLLLAPAFGCEGENSADEPSCHGIVLLDPDVEAEVRDLLNKAPSQPVTDEEIKNVSTLSIDEARALCTLDDFACMDSLRHLELANTPVVSLAPINRIDDLAYLSFFNNNLTELGPLFEGMPKTELRTLIVVANLLDDLDGLETAPAMKHLFLGYNRISDISVLSELPKLVRLSLTHNQVTDLKPLVDNPGLGNGDEIYISDNPLGADDCADIEALRARGVRVYHNIAACP